MASEKEKMAAAETKSPSNKSNCTSPGKKVEVPVTRQAVRSSDRSLRHARKVTRRTYWFWLGDELARRRRPVLMVARNRRTIPDARSVSCDC
ncbi:hypothetical protein SFRURICE_016617 [Spodoptera frugiperda]|nr:hypothetical protein SFRURICE_016617 [Spodoptera frugiperda]